MFSYQVLGDPSGTLDSSNQQLQFQLVTVNSLSLTIRSVILIVFCINLSSGSNAIFFKAVYSSWPPNIKTLGPAQFFKVQ